MSSTSQELYLEGSSHRRTSIGDSQAAAGLVSEDGKGEEEDGAAAGTTQMEAEQGDSATQLDGGLWGSLPEDLQDRILAWLPFPAFARACTVCKRYNCQKLHHLLSQPLAWMLQSTPYSNDLSLSCSFSE